MRLAVRERLARVREAVWLSANAWRVSAKPFGCPRTPGACPRSHLSVRERLARVRARLVRVREAVWLSANVWRVSANGWHVSAKPFGYPRTPGACPRSRLAVREPLARVRERADSPHRLARPLIPQTRPQRGRRMRTSSPSQATSACASASLAPRAISAVVSASGAVPDATELAWSRATRSGHSLLSSFCQ